MSSLSLRNVATAVVLSAVLCLAAAPAAAQPRAQEPSKVEVGFAARVWLWLTSISAPAEANHAREKTLSAWTTSSDSLSPSVLSRAGAFDPNG
jgi:hypothetical protein